MNDPGLEDVIQDVEDGVVKPPQHGGHRDPRSKDQPVSIRISDNLSRREKQRKFDPSDRESDQEEEEDPGIYQPTGWWFASTAFPLIAGSFGPIANLFSVCALVQTWRVRIEDGRRIPDRPWLLALNACSLVFALVANVALLFNFARRIRYAIAQPITITLWYMSALLLVLPIGLIHDSKFYSDSSPAAFSQSYYYGLISSVLYFTISTLLLLSMLGATVFRKYPASFSTLTGPQRTLMLQTISFSLYLALGAGVFARIEGWEFTDGVYWADYTLLTIGLGSDYPLNTTLARMLLIPYAAIGITMIGLVVSSVRGLVLERARAKMVRRFLGKERERWKEDMQQHQLLADSSISGSTGKATRPSLWMRMGHLKRQEKRLSRQLRKHEIPPLKPEDERGAWHRAEFELMRFIELSAESAEQYDALALSLLIIIIVWTGGSLVFWSCEHKSQGWTYTESLYFSYTTLLTIGYGDFYPSSNAGKPFFVVWSLISVPAMTVLISNMGDTVIKWIRDATLWASKWTILPERRGTHKRHLRERKKRASAGKIHDSNTDLDDDKDAEGHSKGKRTAQQRDQENKSDNSDILQHDVEKLGGAVEKFEEEEGRSSALPARIAREITKLAKDINAKPPKKYSWEQWEQWMKMLGERDDFTAGANDRNRGGLDSENHKCNEEESTPAPPVASVVGDAKAPDRRTSDNLEDATLPAKNPSGNDEGEDWQWTWLGDEGPLMSRLTETEWIVEKLCFRLEEVLEDEIREARGERSAMHSAS